MVNTNANPTDSRNDRGDFESHIAHLLRGRGEEDRESLNRFLRANPGMTVGDWKGKGPVVPRDAVDWEQPWHRLKASEVQEQASRYFARELPRNLRQAAARDPAMIWNPLARKYRLRLPSDPQPEGGGHES